MILSFDPSLCVKASNRSKMPALNQPYGNLKASTNQKTQKPSWLRLKRADVKQVSSHWDAANQKTKSKSGLALERKSPGSSASQLDAPSSGIPLLSIEQAKQTRKLPLRKSLRTIWNL